MPMIDKVTVPEGERGLWRVERFQITKTDAAIAAFSYRARVPSPGTYTKLMHGRCLVMSDTPAEMRDHYAFVLAAKGHVLISGLGLGMVLGACLRRPDVETVTVLEIDADLIALVGPHYAGRTLCYGTRRRGCVMERCGTTFGPIFAETTKAT
jgi:hypothetical protein